MTLYYDFDDDYEYEYEVSQLDLDSYINQLSNEKLRNLAKGLYKKLSGEAKKFYKEEYKIDSVDDLGAVFPGVMDAIHGIIDESEDSDIYLLLKSDIEDYFRDEAIEQYLDGQAYRKNPYSYNGLNESDFY